MPSFVHPALLWGLPIVAVPVLIHLINMMRHRRIQWAAMEFLLASQKKNRTWVLFSQFLLLLMRMAAIAAVVLVVAQPLVRSQLGSLLGGSKTHHVVLLDDSFSMSDRWSDTSAFQQAKAVIERIGAAAAGEAQQQKFTLLRFSQAGRISQETQPDLLEEQVDSQFATRLRDTLKPLETSHVAAGPTPALEAIGQLLPSRADEHRIVYLVTDFRARQWGHPKDLRRRLSQLNETGATLKLIDCAGMTRPNLTIARLAPGGGTRAAGVPLFMEVAVKNFGTTGVKDVPVLLAIDDQPQPAVKIAEIPPGEAVTAAFQVQFPTAGEHRITARLESDAIALDNVRYSVVDFPVDLPVLLIDGDPEALDARYLSAALAPGGPVPTGINPRIERPRYLSLNPLDQFRAIYLLNIDRLDPSAIQALEDYIAAGGGVGVFLGQRSRSNFINDQLYRQGEGFFPAPVAGQAELLVDRLQKAPDLEVGSHPIFRIFAGNRNSFISTVIVWRYFSVAKGWRPEPDSTAQIIARLRNGAPLALQRTFGEGRVVAFLTTAAPTWNNWARNNPSFVVAMLELQSFLSDDASQHVSQLVGSPLDVELDPARYEAPIRFSIHQRDASPATTINAVATPDGLLVASLTCTDTSGIYRAELTRNDGRPEVRNWAFNVDPDEGDLKRIEGPQLAARLEGVKYEYQQAATFQYGVEGLAGYNLGKALLYALLLLLIAEQILAWWASYHLPSHRVDGRASRAAGRRDGGVWRPRIPPIAGGVSHPQIPPTARGAAATAGRPLKAGGGAP